MSRSNKGSKATGYDYWSKRPASGNGYGAVVKDITHRRERMINKDILRKEMKDVDH